MNNLLDFFKNNFHWLVFLLLEIASGVMLFSYNSYQGSVWVSTANVTTGKLLEWKSQVQQFFSLTRTNEELSSRNLVLEQQLAIYRERIGHLEERLGATDGSFDVPAGADSLFEKIIAAKVVDNTVNRRDNLITIDRGSRDGVKTDMGVVSGNGLVGVVYMVGDHYSLVLPVLNSRSRISCSIRNRNYFGYLAWEGGSPAEAYLEDVPRHAKFAKGEWVETSGYSAIFPPGIAVGRIIGIYNSPDGLSYRLKVHLSTDFACLRDVYVVSGRGFNERRTLQNRLIGDEEIKMRKK